MQQQREHSGIIHANRGERSLEQEEEEEEEQGTTTLRVHNRAYPSIICYECLSIIFLVQEMHATTSSIPSCMYVFSG